MRIILLALLSLTITSCATKKACDKKYPPSVNVRDSIVIKDSIIEKIVHKTIIKDSTRYTDAVQDSGVMDVTQNETYKFKNSKVAITLKIKDGKVYWKVDIAKIEERSTSVVDSTTSQKEVIKETDKSHENIVTKVVTPDKKWYENIFEKLKDFFAIIGLIVAIYFGFKFTIKRLTG